MVIAVKELPKMGRHWRRPSHPFQLVSKPYQIQPFFIAPVLPGETMKKLVFQARVVTDPIKHPLIGWWKEYYFFYVKHRDLEDRDLLSRMMLDPTEDLSSLKSSTPVTKNFFFANAGLPAIDWVAKCLKRVTECYFRDEGETQSASGTHDGMYLSAAFPREANWMDSLTVDANMPDADPNDASEQAQDPQYRMWQYMTQMQLINMSYEQWLRTWGVNTPKTELHEPEVIRYVRQWQYPSNTIDPTNGAPSSAVSWSIAERADKNRFFKEPGFLFGVTVTRPKVYAKNQKGTLSAFMQDALKWLPPMLSDDPSLSIIQFADNTGPIDTTDTGGYWIDLRDYLMYGEHFTNVDLSAATDKSTVSLPAANGSFKYPTSADITALFKTAGTESIREDGVVSMHILGAQQDNT